ncbi:hypothetical protein BDW67DRAFT_165224 [Aspergillus spinulosporus]
MVLRFRPCIYATWHYPGISACAVSGSIPIQLGLFEPFSKKTIHILTPPAEAIWLETRSADLPLVSLQLEQYGVSGEVDAACCIANCAPQTVKVHSGKVAGSAGRLADLAYNRQASEQSHSLRLAYESCRTRWA